jgi:hypothetical protein
MRFGPTSLKVTTVLAKGLRRQRLRSDLRISEQVISGKKSYVIKVPDTSTYSRYGAYEYEILTLCDGTRTPAEIAAEMSERHPEQPVAETTVLEFFDGMEAGMWERSVGEKNLAMLEKIRDERKTRVNRNSRARTRAHLQTLRRRSPSDGIHAHLFQPRVLHRYHRRLHV